MLGICFYSYVNNSAVTIIFLMFLLLAPDRPAQAENLALSGDNRWVVLASRQELSEAIEIARQYQADGSRVVTSQNGWYAVVLGPYKARNLTQLRSQRPGMDIPSDAYLAKGANFVSTAWTSSRKPSGGSSVATGTGGAGTPKRALRLGNIQFELAFPSRFTFVGRGEQDDTYAWSYAYFKDGDESIAFNFGFYSGGIDHIKSTFDSGPLLRNDLFPTNDEIFNMVDEKIDKTTIWRLYKSASGKYKRIIYAKISCCEGYLSFIGDFLLETDISGWTQEFYKSFNTSGKRAEGSDPVYKWALPAASTPAISDRQRLYDVCAAFWKKSGYAGAAGFKAMTTYFLGKQPACGWAGGKSSPAAAWAAAESRCKERGATKCYTFANGDIVSGWVETEESNITLGIRASEHLDRQVSARQASPAQQPEESGGGFLEDLLGAVPSIVDGFNQGAAVGRALGGNGGYSGGGSTSGGGSGCAQLRANYRQCETSWRNIGGGSTGQAGSFRECMQVYQNAMAQAGC